MNPEKNEHSRKRRLVALDSTSDILSKIEQCLPPKIQHHILCCLPFKALARTSLLSREWLLKWRYTQQFVFDKDYFHSSSSKSPLQQWSDMVDILRNHRGPLRKFVLSVEFLKIEPRLIKQIMSLLSQKDIQELTLRLPSGLRYGLPSNQSDLSVDVFQLRSDFIGFTKLVNLQLHLEHLGANEFKIFTSKCPLLQQLTLKVRQMDGPLEIDAPSLKFLYVISIKSSIIFKKVPVLSRVTVKHYGGLIGGPCSMVGNLFGVLPPLEYFCTSRNFLRYLCAGVLPENPLGKLNHLKCVELSQLCFSSFVDVQYALLLIRLSPNLRKLKIKAYIEPFYVVHIWELEKALSMVDDCFNQLQQVTMEGFNGTASELEFLKFILAKSQILEKITIFLPKRSSAKKQQEIVIAATGFHRASTNAEIIVSVGD